MSAHDDPRAEESASQRSPARPPQTSSALLVAVKLAWPVAFVTVAAIVALALRGLGPRAEASSSVFVRSPTPTIVQALHEVARLETTTLHVEKIIDVKDRQEHLYGTIAAEDALLFVATGEVVLGVDLARLGPNDARFDEATRTAYIELAPPEVLSTRFDELHSYVHARTTDLLATRNEALESIARRQATLAFAAAGTDPVAIARAKAQAERVLEALARAWGASTVVVTWKKGDRANPEGALTVPSATDH